MDAGALAQNPGRRAVMPGIRAPVGDGIAVAQPATAAADQRAAGDDRAAIHSCRGQQAAPPAGTAGRTMRGAAP